MTNDEKKETRNFVDSRTVGDIYIKSLQFFAWLSLTLTSKTKRKTVSELFEISNFEWYVSFEILKLRFNLHIVQLFILLLDQVGVVVVQLVIRNNSKCFLYQIFPNTPHHSCIPMKLTWSMLLVEHQASKNGSFSENIVWWQSPLNK